MKIGPLEYWREDTVGTNSGLMLRITLERPAGWKKETSVSARWVTKAFETPTKEDYAKALECMAKQLREIEE